MSMTDPIADMLTRVRNANRALHETVEIPASKVKWEIARLLKDEGYIEDAEVVPGEVRDTIRLTLKYTSRRERVITDLQRVSKPGRRVYAGKTELPKVYGGLGTAIMSTSNGLLTGQQAAQRGVGGEVLAFVW
jgi:small subunit ribosomal protein S8